MASVTKDDLWKVFSLLMSVLVLPLAGWVWNTNVKVAELQNDLGDAEAVIEKLETELSDSERNSLQIVGIEKDIEYMKGALNRIENIVANGRF
jgi:cell division protein FtsL